VNIDFSLAALSSQADFGRLIAESVPMHRLRADRKDEPEHFSGFLLGETGTGEKTSGARHSLHGLRIEKALFR
jgi:hypothetical protein